MIALVLAAALAREAIPFDRDWTFHYAPAETRDDRLALADDSRWTAIALPHTWSVYETTREVHPFIRDASERDDPYWWYGWGWYRKRFSLKPIAAGKLVAIEFDGVQKHSFIFLNGKLVGEHKGGFTSFSIDLTPYLKPGENVLAVAVSNRRDDPARIPPMTAGNWNVYGGIYRSARLVLRETLHIPYQGAADHEGGTYITTPLVTSARATAQIKTHVKNAGRTSANATLTTKIIDPSGAIIATLRDTHTLAAGANYAFEQSATVAQPKLWSPESPSLYRVETALESNGKITDTQQSPLGFRWFKWNSEQRTLELNGKLIRIHGTNRHQEYPWLGDALPRWLHDRDYADIRQALNHNFQRTAHYPPDPYVLDLADRLGIITVEEVPNIKDLDFDEQVQEQNVKEMIRRDRNHPSIFFWSMGNETSDGADSKWAWNEDRTRILHSRKAEQTGDYITHTEKDLDMENLLRVTIRGWFSDDEHKERPADGQVAGSETWQHDRARVDNASVRGRIDGNIVAWLYADHGGDRNYKDNPLRNFNPKGWVDSYRVPKYMYHLWRANYATEPMVFIQPHHWREKYLGQKRSITVDSNASAVDLQVNGRTIGRRELTNFHTATFENVTIERGTLTAIASNGAKATLHMPGPPAQFTLETSHRAIAADRAGLAIVMANIVDAQGHPVFDATNKLEWKIEGPGRLVGPHTYESDLEKNGAPTGTAYFVAPVANIVRSTATPGRIRVTVSSKGLAPATIEIDSRAPEPIISSAIQPALNDAGRLPVTRDPAYLAPVSFRRPQEIKPLDEHFDVDPKAIEAFIAQRNPKLDTKSIPFQALIARLQRILEKNANHLVADDYNFAIRNYHDARLFEQRLRALNFPKEFADAKTSEYAAEIIGAGASLDWNIEEKNLKAAGAEGRLERTGQQENVETWLGALYTEWAALDTKARRRAMLFLDRLNPGIRRTGKGQAFFTTPNVPIFLPPWPRVSANVDVQSVR